MRGSILTFAVAVMLAGVPATNALCAPFSLAVPPESFINHHVSSVRELTREVTLDRQVQQRLSKHFHMSGPKIVSYIQHNLVLKRLSVAGRYQVYCVSPSGREYVITSRLPVGTPVFVLRSNGKPVLKLACGNPMVAMLPSPPTPAPGPVKLLTSPDLASSEFGPAPGPTPNTLVASAPPVISTVGPGELAITKVGTSIASLPVGHGGPGLG
ncbi:MAG: hypothetical protein M3Y13_07190, partial [Armatimonadota bacterium]|nr:hypothetical protein [Armatimonadota bacterium]